MKKPPRVSLPLDKPGLFVALRSMPADERSHALHAALCVLRTDVRRALAGFEALAARPRMPRDAAAIIEEVARQLEASVAHLRGVAAIYRDTADELV